MKKKLFVLFFLVALVSCGGVNKQDIAEGCASISSSYIDSQLRKGDWKYDPRFNNIRVELKKKKNPNFKQNSSLERRQQETISRLQYQNIAVSAIQNDYDNPSFYDSCIKTLSEDFEAS